MINKICLKCRKKFKVYPCESKQKFCSARCMGDWVHLHPYSFGFQKGHKVEPGWGLQKWHNLKPGWGFQKNHKIGVETRFKKGYSQTNTGRTHFKKGHTSWMKGLTKETDNRVKLISNMKKGEKRPIETREKIRNKLRRGKFIRCKICNKKFYVNPFQIGKRIYCSRKCYNYDKEKLQLQGIRTILKLQNKNELNGLELKGREILQKLKIDFREQVLMFNKFLVDVLVLNKKLIIQWDGSYWHSKRKLQDKAQDKYFSKCGYNVLRITDKEIENDVKDVQYRILNFIKSY